MTTPGARLRACTICGIAVAAPATRCPKHPKRYTATAAHKRMRAIVLADESHCWICGKPAHPNDPLTYDHVAPRKDGVDNSRANSRAAHASCNYRRGVTGIPCPDCVTPTHCVEVEICQPHTPRQESKQRIRSSRIKSSELRPGGAGPRYTNTIEQLPRFRTLIVLCGRIGSGKTSFAQQHFPPGEIVSVDDIRRTLGHLSDRTTLGVGHGIAYESALRRLNQGERVIFDSTATSESVRHNLLLRAQATRASAHLVMLDTPGSVARQRNSERNDPVPDNVVREVDRAYLAAVSTVGSEPWDSITTITEGATHA